MDIFLVLLLLVCLDLPILYKYKLYQYPQGGTAGISDHQSIGRQPGSQHAGKMKR